MHKCQVSAGWGCVKVGKVGLCRTGLCQLQPLCADTFILAAHAFGWKCHPMWVLCCREQCYWNSTMLLCQCSWFHSKSTSPLGWLFPWKSTSSVVLLANLRLTSALTPAFPQHFEPEFVKVEKAPLKQTTSSNSAFRSSSVSLMLSSCVMQFVQTHTVTT